MFLPNFIYRVSQSANTTGVRQNSGNGDISGPLSVDFNAKLSEAKP